ncbi:hypothetical protein [Leptospira borgpetersenii]|uniref:hypothetical protein n=2 Tax=Leptospira borgpetersenii TaxID=174 RepID=UPI00187ED03B|nr:hypothetical protein [Leptospira borgpetersenii serovar Tarassovi]MBE8403925.1 hypothetical protein [Leptospira borgpetersenii serovar Tarassovi]MBE8405959.1 hypothetical protein [Leptospira borgpetersenii serovar Tarassovi]MBE8412476.1 hypothetical protein [Leptospira borgpetersenii serovar Tarassovi]MBE8414833.1 hypothetical protein [Leptospira borgpetersenii serovar Tarassovi]
MAHPNRVLFSFLSKMKVQRRTRTEKKTGGSATAGYGIEFFRSLPQRPRNTGDFWIILAIFCIFIISKQILPESYSEYRLDDLLLLEDGKREITGRGRFYDSQREEGPEDVKGPANGKDIVKKQDNRMQSRTTKFYGNVTALYRGLTQKGGIREEEAKRSFSRGIFSPEVGWTDKGERMYHKILMSPFLQYEETIIGTKTITRGADGELLWITGWESPTLRVGIEVGRGYQRLDRNGFLFVGFLNYGELQIHWKPLGISVTAIGAQMRNTPLYSTRDRSESPQRIAGGSAQMLENRIFQSFRIFYYLYKESKQEAVKGGLFEREEPFRPYGEFQYYGIEFSSAKLFGFRIDADAIQVVGFRQYGLGTFPTPQFTSGRLIGARLVLERPEAAYFLGGLYTSKDSELRVDRNSDGYAGVRTDPRGYGGKTSFLLMESLLMQGGNVFQEDGTVAKPNFENKGMQLLQFGIKKSWNRKWKTQGMILTSSSPMGRGWEGIATAGYQSEYSYILISLSYAHVDPQREKKVFIEEWKIKESIREYSRIYFSAGVYF